MIFTEVEFRSGGSIRVSGYVNAVGRDSRVLPAEAARGADSPFVEQVMPGAFAAAIADNPDVRLYYNHERDIGGAASGELRLREDSIGLFADAVVTDSEIIDAAKKGELRGWSFGFSAARARWEPAGNSLKRRRLDGFKLFEVSILTKTPAYPGTSVELRGAWARIADVIERRFAADNFTAQPVQAAQTAPSGDYYRATVRILELSTGAFPVLPLTNVPSCDTMEEQRARHYIKGAHGYFEGSYSDGGGGGSGGKAKGGKSSSRKVRLSKKEYGKIVSEINTNYSKYEGRKICYHNSFWKNSYYTYKFLNKGFDDYEFFGKW